MKCCIRLTRYIEQNVWYRSSLTLISFLLLPLAALFNLIRCVRYYLYRCGILKITYFSAPIIVVGNITVGGTGKTPLVIALAEFFKSQGFKPGIIARGIGGKNHRVPLRVTDYSSADVVGDEALLLFKRTQCPVVLARKRVHAVHKLLNETDCNLVITDDGLQHYALGRTLEIGVIDGARGLGNGCLLPAGPLREPAARLKKVDFVVRQGTPGASQEYGMVLKGQECVALADPAQRVNVSAFAGQTVHAIAGIGHPERFFADLTGFGLKVLRHPFPDHYLYRAEDLSFDDSYPIMMTEKDAVKCQTFATERYWYLPVTAQLNPEFYRMLLLKLKEKSDALH